MSVSLSEIYVYKIVKSLHCKTISRIKVQVRIEFMVRVIVSIRVTVSFMVMV